MGRYNQSLLFAAVVVVLASPGLVFAQGGFGGTAQGGAGGATGAGTAFGGTGTGGTSFAGSGLNTSAFGTGGQTGFGTTTTTSTTATTTGSTFVGRGSATPFVGRGLGDQNSNVAAGGFTAGRGAAGGSNAVSGGVRPDVRVRIAVSPELAASIEPRTRVVSSGSRVGRTRALAGVTVRTELGVTVLDGVVSTASQRLVAEKLLAIEPGVGMIDNRIEVRTASP